MKRVLILLCCVVLIVAISSSASAARIDREIYYLYRDFKPLFELEDGSVMRRMTVDVDSMFIAVSSLSSANFFRQFGGKSISFTGDPSSSYWVNNVILGSGYPDIDSSEVWNYDNLVSLYGFQSNAKLLIAYSLTGANIETDHHDVWIKYYDQNMVFTEQIQYQGSVSTSDRRFFTVEVPIGVGSNVNNSYFSVMLQIDDIVPTSAGTVSLSFIGCTLNSTGTTSGVDIWTPISPIAPPGSDVVGDVHEQQTSLFQQAMNSVADFTSLLGYAMMAMETFSLSFLAITDIFNTFFSVDWIYSLLSFSLTWGLVAIVLGLKVLGDSGGSSHGSSSKKGKGGIK